MNQFFPDAILETPGFGGHCRPPKLFIMQLSQLYHDVCHTDSLN
jgi:hypothetical protein